MKQVMLAVGVLGLLLSTPSCTKVEEPKFRDIQHFRVKKLGLQAAEIGFDVVYYNPNNFGVNVKEAVVDVYLDSIFVGKFTQAQQVDVAKKADFSIPLEGSIPIAKALQLKVGDVVNKQIAVRADGSVRVGKAGVYVTRDIKYQGKHKLDLNL